MKTLNKVIAMMMMLTITSVTPAMAGGWRTSSMDRGGSHSTADGHLRRPYDITSPHQALHGLTAIPYINKESPACIPACETGTCHLFHDIRRELHLVDAALFVLFNV